MRCFEINAFKCLAFIYCVINLAINSTDQRVKLQAIKYLMDRALGTPTIAKEDVNNIDDKDNKDTNTLKKEIDDIKNLKVVK